MLEKILVCLDGSAAAEQILPYITEEAQKLQSRIILLRVVDLPESIIPVSIPGSPAVPVSTPGAVKRTITEEKEANDYLKHVAKSLRAKGLEVESVVHRRQHLIMPKPVSIWQSTASKRNRFGLQNILSRFNLRQRRSRIIQQ
ncbi:MAG: universal stress protein [Chloroflexi bacterium]|nr:universal stress protein [Chloroflexota bacterium]